MLPRGGIGVYPLVRKTLPSKQSLSLKFSYFPNLILFFDEYVSSGSQKIEWETKTKFSGNLIQGEGMRSSEMKQKAGRSNRKMHDGGGYCS